MTQRIPQATFGLPPAESVLSAIASGALRLRLAPGWLVARVNAPPETTVSKLLVLPTSCRDRPIEATVLALGPPKRFGERYCRGARGARFDACGALARHVAILDADDGPRRYLCADCARMLLRDAGLGAAYIVVRPLLPAPPWECAPGDRVVVSKWAITHHVIQIGHDEVLITNDILAVVEHGAPLVLRGEAA